MSVGRLFWLSLGATAGVLVVRKLTRTAAAYTPEGIASSLSELTEAVREFAGAVRESMDERERELRLALGVDPGAMDPATARQLIDSPTAAAPGPGAGAPDRT